jgi:inorganic pyrophosphatase
MERISNLISDGANSFLHKEYTYIGIFMVIFAILMSFTVEDKLGEFWTVIPFLMGGFTSLIAGYIGMRIAVKANVRTCKEATFSLHRAFIVAFRGGAVLGFVLVGLALLVLMVIIIGYQRFYVNQ